MNPKQSVGNRLTIAVKQSLVFLDVLTTIVVQPETVKFFYCESIM
jgi:hypothetical protein